MGVGEDIFLTIIVNKPWGERKQPPVIVIHSVSQIMRLFAIEPFPVDVRSFAQTTSNAFESWLDLNLLI